VSDKDVRPYSPASNPSEGQKLFIAVSAAHKGIGSDYFKKLSVGDLVEGFGPLGRFILREELAENIVMVASGTGLSPILSMLSVLADKKISNNIRLYFGVRDENELFFVDELDKLQKLLPNFSYEICLSSPSDLWLGNKGYVNDYVKIENPDKTQVYLCGVKEMVETLREKFAKDGVPEENIFW
jgi:Na+-transporting NADH:ubiquinone oxidoreductase subunit F